MATVSAFATQHSIFNPIVSRRNFKSCHSVAAKNLQFRAPSIVLISPKQLPLNQGTPWHKKMRKVRSAAEEEAPAAETREEEGGGGEASSTSAEAPVTEGADQQTVSVPVSPSDTLTMLFQAEGAMSDAAIPKVTNALEGAEGITNLSVQVVEGIASVELTKQTTIQATGVASSLVELMQGSGFKLQTLYLSFEDEEEVLV